MRYKYEKDVDFSTHKYNPNNIIEIDKSLLKELLSLQAPSRYEFEVQNFIWDWVEANVSDIDMTYDSNGNIFITKGTIDVYPCVVAHMDEVNDYSSDRTILELGNIFIGMNAKTGEAAGCPGDDRCGVYVALELLRLLPAIKVAFFVEEEIGARAGSGFCDMSFFNDVAFVLQADRNGNNEIINETNGLIVSSKDFDIALQNVMELYDYHFSVGTFTDVGVLAERNVGVSCINIGAGYYDAHSAEEKVCIPDVENTLNLMYRISNLSFQKWKHEAKDAYENLYSSYSINDWRKNRYGFIDTDHYDENDCDYDYDKDIVNVSFDDLDDISDLDMEIQKQVEEDIKLDSQKSKVKTKKKK